VETKYLLIEDGKLVEFKKNVSSSFGACLNSFSLNVQVSLLHTSGFLTKRELLDARCLIIINRLLLINTISTHHVSDSDIVQTVFYSIIQTALLSK